MYTFFRDAAVAVMTILSVVGLGLAVYFSLERPACATGPAREFGDQGNQPVGVAIGSEARGPGPGQGKIEPGDSGDRQPVKGRPQDQRRKG